MDTTRSPYTTSPGPAGWFSFLSSSTSSLIPRSQPTKSSTTLVASSFYGTERAASSFYGNGGPPSTSGDTSGALSIYHRDAIQFSSESIGTHGVQFSSGIIVEEERVAATAFHQFLDLPEPIRRKIWNMTFPGSRTITVQCTVSNKGGIRLRRTSGCLFPIFSFLWSGVSGGGAKAKISKPRTFIAGASGPAPLALQVCKEARMVALAQYTLASHTGGLTRPLYMNYEKDVLHINDEQSLCKIAPFEGNMFCFHQTSAIKNLMLPVELNVNFDQVAVYFSHLESFRFFVKDLGLSPHQLNPQWQRCAEDRLIRALHLRRSGGRRPLEIMWITELGVQQVSTFAG